MSRSKVRVGSEPAAGKQRVDAPTADVPEVDVVVLSWNDGELIDIAVESVLASSGVDVRAWVIDNGSAEPLEAWSDDRVQVVRNKTNRGVAPARAQGVALGEAPFVCFLDSDARLEPGCLAALVAQCHGSVVLCAPVFAGQSPEASAGRAPSFARKAARGLGLTARYSPGRRCTGGWDVDFAIGACQIFTRKAYEAVGGLDESIFYGPEDVDFCLRLRGAGGRLLQVTDAVCHHPPRRRSRRLLTSRGLRHARALVRHLWRHRGGRVRAGSRVLVAGRTAR